MGDLKERTEISRDEFVRRFTEESRKLNYYDPIKRQPWKLFEMKTMSIQSQRMKINRSLKFL